MNRISSFRLLISAVCILLMPVTADATPADFNSFHGSEMATALPQKKKAGIKKPMSAEKAKKQAEAKDKKRRKEGVKYIEENRERSLEIQTPEVRERMKQNVKDADSRYKAKKKNNSTRTKKAGKKYR